MKDIPLDHFEAYKLGLDTMQKRMIEVLLKAIEKEPNPYRRNVTFSVLNDNIPKVKIEI